MRVSLRATSSNFTNFPLANATQQQASSEPLQGRLCSLISEDLATAKDAGDDSAAAFSYANNAETLNALVAHIIDARV